MQLNKEKRGECSILMVHGRLDGTTSPKFETEVLAWLSGGGKSFVLDMAGISFMSSAALRVLLSMAKRVGRTGGKVVLSSPNAVVSEVFEISNFSAMFTICQTVEEGVTAATAGFAPSAPVAAVESASKAVAPATPVASPKPEPIAPPPATAKPEAPVAPTTEVPPPAPTEAAPPTAQNPPLPTASPSIPKAEEKPSPAESPTKPTAAASTPPPVAPAPAAAPAPPAARESKPAPAPTPAATPAGAAKKAGAAKVELIVGTHIIECRDGDVIGLEGTVAPHLFKSAPSLQPRHFLIGKGTDSWFVMVPRNVEVTTHFDDAVITPGERNTLSGEHRLKIADFAFSLRLSEGSPVSINESFFTRLMKILRLG
jgi:anti-sigma B factor antagonist/stage II sporulation protein AA (anti-sigma F factor antagonist)